jgi:hypothetical protein
MQVLRTPAEAYLYFDLNPCECGEQRFTPTHHLEDREGTLVAVYEGTCPRCGRTRRYEFVLDPDEPPPPPAFGGDRPSQLIDPGQFYAVGRAAAARVPVNLDDLPRDRWPTARDDMLLAIAAQQEVAKFVPPGADAVPAEAFTSDLGRAMYAGYPEDFTRAEIEARLRSYREGMTTFGPA